LVVALPNVVTMDLRFSSVLRTLYKKCLMNSICSRDFEGIVGLSFLFLFLLLLHLPYSSFLYCLIARSSSLPIPDPSHHPGSLYVSSGHCIGGPEVVAE